MNKTIGKLDKKIIKLLGLAYKEGQPIILVDANIAHMQRQHSEDFAKYGKDIKIIIANPTYVAKNPNQDSIEYIKEYKIDNEFVLVAVRISSKGNLFARTLFTMTQKKINTYLKNGYAKKYQ